MVPKEHTAEALADELCKIVEKAAKPLWNSFAAFDLAIDQGSHCRYIKQNSFGMDSQKTNF
ncbi:MAG: hypothetical protein LBQ15_05845 [Clostridium sp.]|jgi:hypothetical protein|nr:hypothetical protein [Clostridium sp.]